MSIAGVC